jgi:peptidoglycan/xylan/chitin deacetylase (PgdA/CDA1 family)
MTKQAGLRRRLVSTSLQGLRSLGAFKLAGNSGTRRDRLLILCYHGVSLADEHEWRPDLYISAEQFRERLRCLRDAKASILSLPEALTRLRNRSLPPRSVAITFDDGFYDFAQSAAPALFEYGYPSTIYLTTYYAKRELPVANLVVDYLLWKSKNVTVTLPEFGMNEPAQIQDAEGKEKVLARIRAWMNRGQTSGTAKDEAAHMIAERLGVDYAEILRRRTLQILSPTKIAELAREGIDVQLHTHRHRLPDSCAMLQKEIEDNRREILELTGKSAVHFCYPSGKYSSEYFPWLRACGIESATTCERGFATQASEMLRLPRVLDDSRLSPVRFEGIVNGLLV